MLLEKRFLVENHTRNELIETFSGEEKFTVSTAIIFIVLQVDGRKTLADGACALISSQQAFAGTTNKALHIKQQQKTTLAWMIER